jgi:hypothetical protein
MEKFEEIDFLGHKIYKIPLSGIDNSKVEKELRIDMDLFIPNMRFQDPKFNKPGIQIDGNALMGDETRKLFSNAYTKVRDTFTEINQTNFISGYQRSWFYIAVPELPNADWHNHLRFHQDYAETFTDWTWVYYVQLPNNCEGDEGKLFFRDKKKAPTEYYSFFPEEGYVYAFDAQLEHLPALSPKSTVDRITAAGNVILNFED